MMFILPFYFHFWMTASYIKILANSANTKCHRFQVKISCCKFIITRPQQRSHVTFLISFFAISRNLLFRVFLPRKNSRKFQASSTERCTSRCKRSGIFLKNLLKVPMKNLNLKKPFLYMNFFTCGF